jgi:hypothetical protein
VSICRLVCLVSASTSLSRFTVPSSFIRHSPDLDQHPLSPFLFLLSPLSPILSLVSAEISASIDADDYFELMIRNAWRMAGGEVRMITALY